MASALHISQATPSPNKVSPCCRLQRHSMKFNVWHHMGQFQQDEKMSVFPWCTWRVFRWGPWRPRRSIWQESSCRECCRGWTACPWSTSPGCSRTPPPWRDSSDTFTDFALLCSPWVTSWGPSALLGQALVETWNSVSSCVGARNFRHTISHRHYVHTTVSSGSHDK